MKCQVCNNDAKDRNTYSATKIARFQCIHGNEVADIKNGKIYLNSGFVIEPLAVQIYGDVYCYWPEQKDIVSVETCSRRCAIIYAKKTNRLLLRLTDETLISPQQEQFDLYVKKHNIKHALALLGEDDWKSEVDELRARLQTHPQSPGLLFNLANAVLEIGHNDLVEIAIQKILEEYQPPNSVTYAGILLSRLQRYQEVDSLYEAFRNQLGNYESMGSNLLSQWAFAICSGNPEKACFLAQLSFRIAPEDPVVFDNYLMTLGATEQYQDGLALVKQNSKLLTTAVSFFNAGFFCIKMGEYENAVMYFKKAQTYDNDPATERYLAESLLHLKSYVEAHEHAQVGLRMLSEYQAHTYKDADKVIVRAFGYSDQQRSEIKEALTDILKRALSAMDQAKSGHLVRGITYPQSESKDRTVETDVFILVSLFWEKEIVKIDTKTNTIVDGWRFPENVSGICVDNQYVWASLDQDAGDMTANNPGKLIAVDPKTNSMYQVATLGAKPNAPMYGHNSIFSISKPGRLIQVNLSTKKIIPLIKENVLAIEMDDKWIWAILSDPSGHLLRIDPSSGKITNVIKLQKGATDLSSDGKIVCVSGLDGVTLVDVSTCKIIGGVAMPTTPYIRKPVIGFQSVFVANDNTRSLFKIDASSARVIREVPIGNGIQEPLIAYNSVWVVNRKPTPTLYRLNPEDLSIIASAEVGERCWKLTAVSNSIWSADWDAQTVTRVNISNDQVERVATIPVGGSPGRLVVLKKQH